MSVKGYGITDILVGFITFVSEISFFASNVSSTYDQPYTGVWSGLLFTTTGMIALKRTSSIGVSAALFKNLLEMSACLSIVCGLVLLSLKAAAIESFASKHDFDDESGDHDYTTQLALELILLICGVSGAIINGLLFYSTHVHDRL